MGLKDIFKSITVEPVMLLYNIASFTQMGVMQDLVYRKVCLHSQYSHQCNDLTGDSLQYVQSESSSWMRYTNIAFSLPAIAVSLYLGSWCSHYGAKVPMLLPALGGVFSNLINVIVSVYINTSIYYLILSQFIAGMLGGSISVTMAAMSYISLISTTESRSVRIGVLESMLFFGATIGPFLGGFLLDQTNYAVVFLFLLAVNVAIVLYVLVLVENVNPNEAEEAPSEVSLTEEKPFTCKELFGYHHFLGTLTVCFRRRDHDRRKMILALVVASGVVMLCTAGEQDITLLFTKDEPLKWKYDQFSYYSGVKHGLGASMLFFGMPLLKRFFNPRDTVFGAMGLLSKMAGLTLLGLSTTTTSMFLVPLLAIMYTYPVPVMRSMLSKLLDPTEHGKMFAFVACMENVVYLLATLIFNSLYPATRSFFHGFVFIMAAVLLIIPLMIMAGLHRIRSREDTPATPEEDGYSNMS